MIQAPVFVRDASAVLGRMVVGTGFQNGTIMSDYAAEEERQRCLIEAAMTAAAFVLADVWRRYVETGGHADLFELEAYLGGLMPLPVTECNLLARALNELIDEEPPLPRAPYRPEPPPGLPSASAGIGQPWGRVGDWLWRFPGSLPE